MLAFALPAAELKRHPGDVDHRTETKPQSFEATNWRLRRHQRTQIGVRAIVRAGLSSKPIVIRDISSGGVGIAEAVGLFPGSEVTICLVTGESKVGVVRWWLAGSCGVQFREPLTEDDRFFKAVYRKAKLEAIGARRIQPAPNQV